MIAALKGLLVGKSRFLQEINHHVGSRKFSGLIETQPVKMLNMMLRIPD